MIPKTYQDNFHEYHLKGSLSSAEAVIPVVREYVKPNSVIDIGCGVGAWLSVWKKNGVSVISGIDGDYVDTSKLLIGKSEFKAFNLENNFTSGNKYDLVTCLEVAEHIPASLAEKFISSLCSLGDLILFSAAIPAQEGTMHINEQYPGYWVDIFNKNGYIPVDCLRQRIWNNPNIQWWYRQNILFFVKKEAIANYPGLIKMYNPGNDVPALVHPALFEEKVKRLSYYEEVLNSPLLTLKHGIKKIFRKN